MKKEKTLSIRTTEEVKTDFLALCEKEGRLQSTMLKLLLEKYKENNMDQEKVNGSKNFLGGT